MLDNDFLSEFDAKTKEILFNYAEEFLIQSGHRNKVMFTLGDLAIKMKGVPGLHGKWADWCLYVLKVQSHTVAKYIRAARIFRTLEERTLISQLPSRDIYYLSNRQTTNAEREEAFKSLRRDNLDGAIHAIAVSMGEKEVDKTSVLHLNVKAMIPRITVAGSQDWKVIIPIDQPTVEGEPDAVEYLTKQLHAALLPLCEKTALDIANLILLRK